MNLKKSKFGIYICALFGIIIIITTSFKTLNIDTNQNTKPAYCIFDNVQINDSTKLEEYKNKVFSVVEKYEGKYVVAGGEIPAMILIDAVSRLLPEVLGNVDSALADSFSSGILDCPHYTRPEVFENMAVPEVLLSGNHKKISAWREQQAAQMTKLKRPDLLEKDCK